MNRILKRTHVKKNVDLLKARDYYFDLAKHLNFLKTMLAMLPPALLLSTYIFALWDVQLLGRYDELIIGAITTIVTFVNYPIDGEIQKNAGISNQLRNVYDSDVLRIKYNNHMYPSGDINEYLPKANRKKYNSKYECWYSEVFSGDSNVDVFCCQLDNLLYSKYAYSAARVYYFSIVIVFTMLVLLMVALTVTAQKYSMIFLVLFSAVECYDVYISKILSLNAALELCCEFCDYAKGLTVADLNNEVLEQAQEIVNANRNSCIFVPRHIRNKYIKDENPFYIELDEYKHIFMGDQADIPDTAADIDVVFEDGSDAIPLREIQTRLMDMMEKVVRVLDDAGINYSLDGGTLIGAKRDGTNGFIPWDDDIDIAIPYQQVEKAKHILREKLCYIVQDTENEPYYSPRLSIFKIREPNEQSRISEKDSLLYTHYKHNGLFIDVYAYSPILVCKVVDSIFRLFLLHPLNWHLERIENRYPANGNYDRQQKRFFAAKKRYECWLAFYAKYARNKKVYAYFPGYIFDFKKPGPYHKAEELFGVTPTYASWEAKLYKVPADPEAILCAYYGPEWETPPFRTRAELTALKDGLWYRKASKKTTALKHIANIISYRRK